MADALASGASVRKDMGVQVPPRAPIINMGLIDPYNSMQINFCECKRISNFVNTRSNNGSFMRSVKVLRILLKPFCQIPGVFPLVANPLLRKMNLGRNGRIHTTILHHEFEIDLNDYTQRRAWLGVFEKREIRFVEQFLRPGDIAIDAGANIGLLTVPMAKAVSKTGRVIAFEPIPQNIEHLHTNLYLNNIQNVSTTQCALGDTNDLIYLTDLHTSKDHSTGFFHFTEDENSGFPVEQILLGDALDNELDKQAPVRLLKIDVEGMEERVLVGLGEWLQPQRIQAILFETFIGPEGFSTPSQSVLILLRNHGYEICEVQSSGKLSISMNMNEATRKRDTTLNLVAVTPLSR